MIQHSNAPWTIGIDSATIRAADGELLAIIQGDHRTRYGNAKVIVAAPALVLALRGLMTAGAPGSAEHDAAVEKARAALRMAGL
jgi:uncharacterized protein YjeT (DUF2065 family)